MNDEGLIKDKYEKIIKEFQTIISTFYLLLLGIGMLFSYSHYAAFGINIFEYADVFDFLIKPFQDITIFLWGFFIILWSYLMFKSDIFISKKFPRFYKVMNSGINPHWWSRNRKLLYFFMGINLLCLFAYIDSLEVKRKIKNSSFVRIIFVDSKAIEGIQIGKISETFFILEGNDVKAIPVFNIKEIQLKNRIKNN